MKSNALSAATVLLAAILASCSPGRGDMPLKTFSLHDTTDYSITDMTLDLPSGNDAVATAIRQKLMEITDDYMSTMTSYENTRSYPPYEGDLNDAEAYVNYQFSHGAAALEQASKQFSEDMAQDGADDYEPICLEYDFSLTREYETSAFAVFLSLNYTYLGGAHGGVVGRGPLTFDKNDGSLTEILDRSKEREIQPLLIKGLTEYFSSEGVSVSPEDLFDYLLLDGKTIPLPVWEPSPSKEGLTFTYQQYEIAAYAAGMPSFTVPYNDMTPYLSARGKRLFCLK